MAGQFAPAIGSDFSLPGVQADDDVAAKRGTGILQKARVFNGGGADDDVAQSGVQIALNGVQVADAAAQLNIDLAAHGFQDFADRHFIFRLPGKRTVEVHQMQTPRALGQPGPGHNVRVFTKRGGLVHVALLEANAVAVFQVNCRD